MAFTLATWNINSIRLRAGLLGRLIDETGADIICLQECKAPVDKMPLDAFAARGYRHWAARGEKGYNGVAILSRLPIEEVGAIDFAGLGQARHIAVRLPGGVLLHNLYVPAGGDVPDRETNPKFGQKLDFVAGMGARFGTEHPERAILVGDLNIAPREDDVWSHRQLLGVVSHTPEEVDHLTRAQAAGGWVDVVREHIPEGKLYSWWSYRARDWQASDRGRRLDHVWASADIAGAARDSRILKAARGWERPSDHAPVLTRFDL